MSDPTRLTAEDLPTLRTLEAFWVERQRVLRRTRPRLHRLVPGIVTHLTCQLMVLYARRSIEAIEHTGHLASDERVDKDGRVTRL